MILFFSRSSNPEYFFMSNFYDSPFTMDGKLWKTVEHYYQAQKSLDENTQESMRNLEKPGDAAYAGRRLPDLRSDWEEVKVGVMYNAVYEKFKQNQDIQFKLLQTGDQDIHEDSPKDFTWGWRNNGHDYLGKILVTVRRNLKNEREREKDSLLGL